jgi:hypothetical protein
LARLSVGSIVASSRWQPMTLATPSVGTSVVVLRWKFATEALSAGRLELPPAPDYGPAVTLTDRRRRMTEYPKDIPPVVEPRWRPMLGSSPPDRATSLPFTTVTSGIQRTTTVTREGRWLAARL